MGRLIDEDFVKRRMHETMDYQDLYLPVHFEMCMGDAPTIDAVPVRHGEWKPFDLTYGRSIYSCSVCEQATEVPMCMEKPMYAYCPNCGAKMEVQDGSSR